MEKRAHRAASVSRPEQGALFDLSARAKFRLTGADRLRYLNGQMTNDLRKASETNTIHACVLNTKGKIDAEVFVAAENDGFVIDTDPEMREQLPARLERYIIADDVMIDDVTDDFALFHVLGVEPPTLAPGETGRKAARFGASGTDVWLPRAGREARWQELGQSHSVCDDDCAEMFRIERGLPRWGRELTDAIIPTEANLEESTIDYAKGCYIGQEIISRIKMSGQTNKRLCGLLPESASGFSAGMRLVTPDQKDVGWITSAVFSAQLGRQIALGFVKRGFQTPGLRLTAVGEGAAAGGVGSMGVQVVSLPFV